MYDSRQLEPDPKAALLVLEGLVDSVVDRLGLALAAAEQITKKSV